MKKCSIKDVARVAGVSIATVSYVLTNKHVERITEYTKKRIHQAIDELGYRPNRIAQSLKTNKSALLGFVVADITNPFFAELAKLVENEAMKHGYTLLIGSADENAEKFDRIVQSFMQQQVEGLILAPVENCESSCKKLDKMRIPYVFLDRYFPHYNTSGVRIDNAAVAGKIAKHLLDNAKKLPIVVSYDTTLQHLVDRRTGFLDIYNGDVLEIKVNSKRIHADVWNGLSNIWLENGLLPDSIYFTSNKLAFEGLKYFMLEKQECIDSLEIITFDKSIIYDFFPGNIYYINQPLLKMAEETMKILIHKITEENEDDTIVNLQLDADLILNKEYIF